MIRISLPPMPSAPPAYGYGGYGGYRGGDTIRDLLLQGGDIAAQGAAQSGQIWGNALSGLGATIGGALQQHSEKAEMAKRDAAMTLFIENWDGQDQRGLLTGLTKILGPQEGPRMAQTVLAVATPQAKDPATELKGLTMALDVAGSQSDDVMARMWPALRQRYTGTLEKLGISGEVLPEQWTPEVRKPMEAMLKALGGGPKAEGPIKLGENERLIDPTTKEVLVGATPKPEAPKLHKITVPGPGGVPVEKLVTEEELRGGVRSYEKPATADEGRLVQVMGPQGTPIWVREAEAVGKPAAQAPRAVTGQERQALAFYNRAKQAIDDVTPIEESVSSKSGLLTQAQLRYAPNLFQSDEQQAYRQAQRAFTEARLRKESGAAIPPHEYDNDSKTYFAQPGDSASTIEQKRRARAKVLEGLAFGAGKAFDEFYGSPMTKGDTGTPPRVSSEAEYNALPKGARYMAPDGRTLVKS